MGRRNIVRSFSRSATSEKKCCCVSKKKVARLRFEGVVAIIFVIYRMGTGFGRAKHDLRCVACMQGSRKDDRIMASLKRADRLRWQRHRPLVLHNLQSKLEGVGRDGIAQIWSAFAQPLH